MDCHIGGKHWLPLTPTEGPHVRYANVVGFDNQSACKNGLPIIVAITKIIGKDGQPILACSYHWIYNISSTHTLLSTYELREAGIIIDDVSKCHLCSLNGERGTQTLYFKEDIEIALHSQCALMTCMATLPTMAEYTLALQGKIHLVDIGIMNWNPKHYNDDLLALPPPILLPVPSINMVNSGSGEHTIDGCTEPQTDVIDEKKDKPSDDEVFHDVQEHQHCFSDTDLYYFDTEDANKSHNARQVHGLSFNYSVIRAFHLTIHNRTIGQNEKGLAHHVLFTTSGEINNFLTDIMYEELTGHSEAFD